MNRPMARQKSGFTLIELLVAIAIIGVLVALLTPAVQAARESARRMTCRNQLRQLGMALQGYHASHDCFPPGSIVMGPGFPTLSGWGWGAMVLPGVEQQGVYEQIDFKRGTAVGGNLALIARPIPLWRCPSDASPDAIKVLQSSHQQFDLASGNYCGSEGILDTISCVRMSDIRDGASNTLLLGERLVQIGLDGTLPHSSAWCGQVAFSDGYEWRSLPHLSARAGQPINASELDPLCFGSRHAGGANFALADGSVVFLSQNIDGAVFEALGTASGREVVEVPW